MEAGLHGASVALRSRRVRSTVEKSSSGRRWTWARAWATRASSLAKSAAVGHVTSRTAPLGSASTRFGSKTLSQLTSYTLSKPSQMEVSSLYSSIRHSITQSYTQTVRQWLSTQSYEAQREFGLLAIENVRKGFW